MQHPQLYRKEKTEAKLASGSEPLLHSEMVLLRTEVNGKTMSVHKLSVTTVTMAMQLS